MASLNLSSGWRELPKTAAGAVYRRIAIHQSGDASRARPGVDHHAAKQERYLLARTAALAERKVRHGMGMKHKLMAVMAERNRAYKGRSAAGWVPKGHTNSSPATGSLPVPARALAGRTLKLIQSASTARAKSLPVVR